MPTRRRHRLYHEQRIFLQTLLAGLPAVIVAFWLLFYGDHEAKVQWTLACVILSCWFGFALAVRTQVVRPLQTMANLLSALREGDFSIRARGATREEALGDVMAEINLLSRTLQEQRMNALEATALLRTVMEEIDVAIFAFDEAATLRLVNRAGQELLAQSAENILGHSAADVGLAECLEGEDTRVLTTQSFPGGSGRWGMRRTRFREGGLPHHLVVIADISDALREEEAKAWQRLVRVLGHELNNSLAPIKSIAGSLSTILRRSPRLPDWEDDMRSGLDIIANRADNLTRFMQAYAKLARLPAPSLAPSDVPALIHRAVGLELRLPVRVTGGPNLSLECDTAQIEQVLINLLRNAVEAAMESRGEGRDDAGVRIGWTQTGSLLEITITDDGPGLANTHNLFVPFFTTKPQGSGIGLVLCRQIATNHGGNLTLENRADGIDGCVARLRLPLGHPV